MKRAARHLVRKWRSVLQIEPRWQIKVEVMDPSPGSLGALTFNSEIWRAVVSVSRELADRGSEIERVVVHELLELATYETLDVFWSILDQHAQDRVLADALNEIYKRARNRQIETLVAIIVGER